MCRLVSEFAGRVESDSGLGGVGDYESHFRLLGKCEELFEIPVRVDAPADDIDHLNGIHGLALVDALKIEMIEPVLFVEDVNHTFLDRLDHYHGGIEVSLSVRVPYYPFYKSAKEIAFSELNDFFSVCACLRRAFTIQSFHTVTCVSEQANLVNFTEFS